MVSSMFACDASEASSAYEYKCHKLRTIATTPGD